LNTSNIRNIGDVCDIFSGKPAALPRHGDAHTEAMLWKTLRVLIEGSNSEEKLQRFMDSALMNAYMFYFALPVL
jgi:membrane protein required for beta-lactamase induction